MTGVVLQEGQMQQAYNNRLMACPYFKSTPSTQAILIDAGGRTADPSNLIIEKNMQVLPVCCPCLCRKPLLQQEKPTAALT
jgi:hypothetical protein